ncbi:hypothetical protein SDC9_178623 [bioreactor metagenome]|uniref:Uncharacterized protein n=1 Tax=bioreactor metagenome TaxID=1076179 RepID=A0A645GZI9_9ZZZZ
MSASTKPMFCSITDRLARSISTRWMVEAPREAASMPTTPLPENRSRNEQSSKFPKMANNDVRILSMAGRISPGGHLTVRPQYMPPVILIAVLLPCHSYQQNHRMKRHKFQPPRPCCQPSMTLSSNGGACRRTERMTAWRACNKAASSRKRASTTVRTEAMSGKSVVRFVKRNLRNPDCLVPATSPGPRMSRSCSAM